MHASNHIGVQISTFPAGSAGQVRLEYRPRVDYAQSSTTQVQEMGSRYVLHALKPV